MEGASPPDAVVPDAPPTDAPPPPPGCEGYPGAPEVLVEDEGIRPSSVALRGETLFFGAVHRRPLTEDQSGALFRVSTRGGRHEEVSLREPFYGGGLLVGPDYLVYHQVRAIRTGGASWSFLYPAIVVEAEGAMPRVLVTELETDAARASATAIFGEDRVVFGRHRAAPSTERGNVGIYDIRTGEESTLLDGRDLRRAVGGGGFAYLYVYDDRGGLLLVVDPSGSVDEVTRFDDFNCCWLWAADDEGTLFLKRNQNIEAWPLGGSPFVVAEHLDRITPAAVDDRFLYWADSADILYVDKRGGPVQTLVDTDTSYVEDLTTDGCGVFWSAVNPPRVLVRSVP